MFPDVYQFRSTRLCIGVQIQLTQCKQRSSPIQSTQYVLTSHQPIYTPWHTPLVPPKYHFIVILSLNTRPAPSQSINIEDISLASNLAQLQQPIACLPYHTHNTKPYHTQEEKNRKTKKMNVLTQETWG